MKRRNFAETFTCTQCGKKGTDPNSLCHPKPDFSQKPEKKS